MFNMIKADIYRTFHKKSLYYFMAICAILFSGLTIIMKQQSFSADDFLVLMNLVLTMVPIVIGLFIFGVIYNDEFRSKSMQTAIGFGMSRSSIVLVKFIDSLIYLFLTGVIVGGFIGLSSFIVGIENVNLIVKPLGIQIIMTFVKMFVYFTLAAFVGFYFQKGTESTVAYILLVTGSIKLIVSLIITRPFIVDIFGDLQPYLITSAMDTMLMNLTVNISVTKPLLIIIGYIIVAVTATILIFNRKELEF